MNQSYRNLLDSKNIVMQHIGNGFLCCSKAQNPKIAEVDHMPTLGAPIRNVLSIAANQMLSSSEDF